MMCPDIQFMASVLCTFAVFFYINVPGANLYKALLNMLGYLKKTKLIGFTYGGKLRVPLSFTKMPDCFGECYGLHTYHNLSFGKDAFPWGVSLSSTPTRP